MKVYKDKKLKVSLFLLPTCVILVTLCVILSIFNIVIHKYISAVTSKEMDNELKEFDIAYSSYNKKYEYLDENGNEEFIIPINYIIIDDEYNLVFPNEPWESIREKNRTKAISNFLKDNSIVYKEGIINKVKIEGNTYYIKSKIYKGKYDGVFVSKDSEEKDFNYIVLLYANITPIQKFLDLLNKILILLMGLSGFMSILIIFHMAKKIDTSFHKLKSYIIKVGERGNLSELDNLVYTEFNDVAKTVQEMSKMISQVEESQKQFFQNASHELRTPLMSIQGYAEGIKSDVIKNKKRAAEIIIKESEKMSSLVNEILFLSKLEVYEGNVNKELIDIKELIYDCSWNIKSIADNRKYRI
ncbi:putative periplasmic sensor signal transduction histidine kinase [Clostridium perfringens D str. JGS1721]|uniref:histidine kinase n=1 Tax=Clostridium perfringens D str. JGS1721 TaxID=488537 RepID=B1V6M3_CLOPF|nr:HAMP domain-containing sensor histidine kinase [Clostridium perfringens]EDT70528.1 putative periplasmic sensor signal transduction histidine kinase [Clostridium perfringens D str. JGS1721]